LVLSEDEKSDNEDSEETELGVLEDQRSVILHLISQLKLGMDLTKVGWCVPLDLCVTSPLDAVSVLKPPPFTFLITVVSWGKRPLRFLGNYAHARVCVCVCVCV
jgi:hypothetical protein